LVCSRFTRPRRSRLLSLLAQIKALRIPRQDLDNRGGQQRVAAKLRHPSGRRLSSFFNADSRYIVSSLASGLRFDWGGVGHTIWLAGFSVMNWSWFHDQGSLDSSATGGAAQKGGVPSSRLPLDRLPW
jgi:hypothetical protein